MTAVLASALLSLALAPGPANAADELRAQASLTPAARVKLAKTPEANSVSAFVQTDDPDALRVLVEDLGGSIRTIAGDVVTVTLPAASLPTLRERLPTTSTLEIASRVQPRLDRVRREMRVDTLHNGAAATRGPMTGDGVLVGIIDIELDLGHPAFRSPDGTSRVVALWDQAFEGQPPEGRGYGHLCSEDTLLSDACPHTVKNDTHGTHVAAIAAGAPVGDAPHYGIAPAADIAFVNLGEPSGIDSPREALTTAVCDAVAWIFEIADERGQAAVINMSLGTHSGPHNGESLADSCLDNLTGPGRVLVAAAGNEGQGSTGAVFGDHVQVHASGAVTPSVPVQTLFLTGRSEQSFGVELAVWAEPADDLQIRVGVLAEDSTIAWSDPVIPDGPFIQQYLSTNAAAAVGPVLAAAGIGESGDTQFQVQVVDDDGDQAEGAHAWVLEVAGSGSFDAFIDTTSQGGFVSTPESLGVVDSQMTIGFPAIASQVLAVGSFVSRSRWTAAGAEHTQLNPITQDPVVEGALSAFSSVGPSRSPEVTGLKPDITAPGELVASALADAVADQQDAQRIIEDRFVLLEGTSMAAPAVAGAVALMLEADPDLTAEDIRQVWDATAQQDGQTTVGERWGRGRIDAQAAVEMVSDDEGLESAGTTGDDTTPADDVGEEGSSQDSGCSVGSGTMLPPVWLIALLWVRRSRR